MWYWIKYQLARLFINVVCLFSGSMRYKKMTANAINQITMEILAFVVGDKEEADELASIHDRAIINVADATTIGEVDQAGQIFWDRITKWRDRMHELSQVMGGENKA